MVEFFKVQNLQQVLALGAHFSALPAETVVLTESLGRILAQDVRAPENLPEFARATMDGYAVAAAATFGASESNPAYLDITGTVAMGRSPDFELGPGQCAKISTGGMLPKNSDAVVMVEHTEKLDDRTIEIYRSVAPGQHAIAVGEDFLKDSVILEAGKKLRPQEVGLFAAMGIETVPVFRKPVVGIISTGDEITPISQTPAPGQIRDINAYSLAAQVTKYGGLPRTYGICTDNARQLSDICTRAFSETDMVLISGGSSVGTRDFTISALTALPDAEVLVHGISISPGKPTILARVGQKPFWGLPGHVVSAMVVFEIVVRPFLNRITGWSGEKPVQIQALLSRNLASHPGRTDFVRVRLRPSEKGLVAEPVLGKSGLINTMVFADGLIRIDENSEGLDQFTPVDVMLI